MKRTRRALLGSVGAGVALGLAGCTSDDETTTTTAPGSNAPGSETDGTPGGTGAVRVRAHEAYGDVLVDAEGLTLYMFDSDTNGAGASTCAGDCAATWPPLTTEETPTAGGDVSASLTTFERDDGATQVAAAGWPLYYYASDEAPGDANGQGVGGVWWVLAPDGTPRRQAAGTDTPTPDGEGTDSGVQY